MQALILFVIKVYQWTLSPFLGGACRFYPSCSRYAAGCVERFGALEGTRLGLRRLLKCHPWHPGGFDPVPEPRGSTSASGSSPCGS